MSHLICGGVYDWSTGLLYQGGRYFDPALGIWLALLPLAVVQGGRKRKSRRQWVLLLCVALLAVGMLAGCEGQVDWEEAESLVCTEIPPDPPMQSIGVQVHHHSGPNAGVNGEYDWRVRFELDEKAPTGGGWIVQEVHRHTWWYNSATGIWENRDNMFAVTPFWEAWRVEENRKTRERLFFVGLTQPSS